MSEGKKRSLSRAAKRLQNNTRAWEKGRKCRGVSWRTVEVQAWELDRLWMDEKRGIVELEPSHEVKRWLVELSEERIVGWIEPPIEKRCKCILESRHMK